MPAGGDALASATSSRVGCACHWLASQQRDAGRAGGEHHVRALDGRAALLVGSPRRSAATSMPKRDLMDGAAACTASSLRPVMATVAPSLASSAAARWPTGPGAREHHGALARERAPVREPRHRRRGRGVRAVAVEHDRDAELAEELGLHGAEQRLAGGHVAAADEYGGVFLVLRAAREYRALDQAADVGRVHAAIGGDVIGAAVVSHDVVENRGQGIRIELVQ